MKIYYSENYVAPVHAFDTTRKAAWIAASLQANPIRKVTVCPPEPVDEALLEEVHDPEYVQAVRTGLPRMLALSQGFDVWDPGLWTAVCASTGGAIAAGLTAMTEGVSGSLSSGLHHAGRGRGNGFCTFNGLVLAAHAALEAGAKKVLILDLDAHCGGGTHSLVAHNKDIVHLDVSVNGFDSYRPAHPNTLKIVERASDYLPTIESQLHAAGSRKGAYDLCLYNAGMDPYEGSSIGGLHGISREVLAEREKLVFDWSKRLNTPIAFVLAGGYIGTDLDEQGLVELHRLTIAAAANISN